MNIQVKHQDLQAIQDRISIINQYVSTLDFDNPELDQLIDEVIIKINSVIAQRGLGTTHKTVLEK